MESVFEGILYQALKKKASDIHLISRQNFLNIDFRIKGQLINYTLLDLKEGNKLVNYIKFQSNIDLNYQLIYKTGSFEFLVNEQFVPLRVSFIPTHQGSNLVIRILGQQKFKSITALTKQKSAIEYFNQLLKYQAGLILMSGPTGVGKSTTLHTLLNEMYQQQKLNIITIEDPIEIVEENFIQIQLSANEKQSFEKALRQILRHDPDVVMIGEIRDELSAQIAVRLALTGCLVFASIHAKDCIGTLQRLFNLQLNLVDLKEVLVSVICQRLIYEQSTAIYEWLDLKQLKQYYQNQLNYYARFNDHLQQLLEVGLIRLEDLVGTEFESLSHSRNSSEFN